MIGTKAPPLAYAAPPRVNLLPPAERGRRERSALVRRWGGIGLAVVAAMVVLSGAAGYYEHTAHSALDRERDRTTALAEELATYHDVSTATRTKGSYEAFRTTAMADDVSWSPLFGKLRSRMPAGAAITGFDAVTSPSAAAGGTASGSSGAPTAAAAAPQGTAVTVTLTLTSRRPLDQKTMLLDFERIPGVLRVDLTSLSSDQYPSYTATTIVYFDDRVYSGRYAQAAGR